MGTPDSRCRGASLFRATPRVKSRRAGSSFVSQPEGGRQFENDPAGTSRRYGGPQRQRQLNQADLCASRLGLSVETPVDEVDDAADDRRISRGFTMIEAAHLEQRATAKLWGQAASIIHCHSLVIERGD